MMAVTVCIVQGINRFQATHKREAVACSSYPSATDAQVGFHGTPLVLVVEPLHTHALVGELYILNVMHLLENWNSPADCS